MNLDEFLAQAGDHGPCVGIHPATSSPVVPPAGVELRSIDGAHTKTVNALFDAFAEAWHFPPWFGRNTRVSCMRTRNLRSFGVLFRSEGLRA